MTYYSMVELSSSNGISEFNLEKSECKNKTKLDELLSNTIMLIDQNILLNIEQGKKEFEICQLVKNKIISPLFYLIERFHQNNGKIENILNDDIPRFNSAFKKIIW